MKIGFGTKNDTTFETLDNAYNSGFRFIDTKDTNTSIKNIAQLVDKYNRDDLFICSKLMGEYRDSKNHIPTNVRKCCLESLKKASLDYWNLYYIHTTWNFKNIPIIDTYNEIVKLKNDNLCKFIGLSNIVYDQLQFILINSVAPNYIQTEIHPFLIEEELVNLCKKHNIKIVAHSPLGNKYLNEIFNHEIITKLSIKYSKSPAQLILQWHIQRGIIPIPSTTNISHMEENFNIDFTISDEDINIINSLNCNKRAFYKPNHIVPIEKYPNIKLPERRKIRDLNFNNYFLNEINKKGYVVCSINDIESKSNENMTFYEHCNNINNNINNNQYKMEIHFRRKYEKEHIISTEEKETILNSTCLKELAKIYMECNSVRSNLFIKTSYAPISGKPSNTALWHRDRQKQHCLKAIIYLNDVYDSNGPLKVVYPEDISKKINWFIEPNEVKVPRTTYSEILYTYGKKNIHSLNCPKFTCILIDGSILHAGGFVLKGERTVIYIEFEHA